MSNHTTLHINCQAEQKQAWLLSARIAGLPFEDWVKRQLDAANIDPAPKWSEGLSERATICLLSGGFNSKTQVRSAAKSGFDFTQLSNCGYKTENEIRIWLKLQPLNRSSN